MKPVYKGLVLAAIHICLVSLLGAKLLYDRETLPRVWVRAAPFDPSLPIRGRYVSLQLVVEPVGLKHEEPSGKKWRPPDPVVLRVENNRLLAEASPDKHGRPSALQVIWINRGNEKVPVLREPVAFFIPEPIPDPSVRKAGEGLWVEATVPKKGPPRPIRLGVKKDVGPIVPLDIR